MTTYENVKEFDLNQFKRMSSLIDDAAMFAKMTYGKGNRFEDVVYNLNDEWLRISKEKLFGDVNIDDFNAFCHKVVTFHNEMEKKFCQLI